MRASPSPSAATSLPDNDLPLPGVGALRLVGRGFAGSAVAEAAPALGGRAVVATPERGALGTGLDLEVLVVAPRVAGVVRRPAGTHHAVGKVLAVPAPAFRHIGFAQQP